MPLFQYKGYRAGGGDVSGTIEADGLHDAIAKVKASGVYPRNVKESSGAGHRSFFRRFDHAYLPYLTRQLATLISAGVPLVEALRSLSEEGKGGWKELLVDVRERVSSGASLSRAFESHRDTFPEFYIHMVAAGEQSGAIDRILPKLADFLETQSMIRTKVRSALIYPAFMSSIGFIVMFFLFTFVVPKIVRIFENAKSALPFITVILIYVSNFFVHYWWLIIGTLLLVIWWSGKLKTSQRQRIDRFILKIPVIESLSLARFTRTLGFLLDGGLPMLRALELGAKSTGNSVLEAKVLDAAKKVAEGARLSASLEGFPSVLLQLISTGEKSGTLAEILNKSADSYEEQFDRKVRNALALLEPVMILVMGLAVGFIVLAVLLPMFQLNQIVK